jgi:hypothetical protein
MMVCSLSWPLAQASAQTLNQRIQALEAKLRCVTIQGTELIVTGCNVHILNGMNATIAQDSHGLGNLIIGYNEVPSGAVDRTGSHNLVIGPEHIYSSTGGLVAGWHNTISGVSASVSGGAYNTASGARASISGGTGNTAIGRSDSVSGGQDNTANSNQVDGAASAHVSGGFNNLAIGDNASVSGGHYNEARGHRSSVSGGQHNTASGQAASVSGGRYNQAIGYASSVSGGGTYDDAVSGNQAIGDLASISGGYGNDALGLVSSVSGGQFNQASGTFASVSGGYGNNALGPVSSVSAGQGNSASGNFASVCGGVGHIASTAESVCDVSTTASPPNGTAPIPTGGGPTAPIPTGNRPRVTDVLNVTLHMAGLACDGTTDGWLKGNEDEVYLKVTAQRFPDGLSGRWYDWGYEKGVWREGITEPGYVPDPDLGQDDHWDMSEGSQIGNVLLFPLAVRVNEAWKVTVTLLEDDNGRHNPTNKAIGSFVVTI